VKSGDSCDSIAANHNMCIDDFKQLNGSLNCDALPLDKEVIVVQNFCSYAATGTPPPDNVFPELPPADSSQPGTAKAIQFFDYLQDVAAYCVRNPAYEKCPTWAKDGVLDNAEVIKLTSNLEIVTTDENANGYGSATSYALALMRIDWENKITVKCGGDINNPSAVCRIAVGEFLGRYQMWYRNDREYGFGEFSDPEVENAHSILQTSYWDANGLEEAKAILAMNDGDGGFNDIKYYVDASCFDMEDFTKEKIADQLGSEGQSYVLDVAYGNDLIFMSQAQWEYNLATRKDSCLNK